MKKVLVCILSLTMMLFLTACGNTEGTSSAAQKAAAAEKSTPSSAKVDSVTQHAKTVIPFCTSAGDVLTGKEADLPKYGKGMTLREGLGLEGKRVQENPDRAKADVMKWLKGLGFMKQQ